MTGMIPNLSHIKDLKVLKLTEAKEMDLIITKMQLKKCNSGRTGALFIIDIDGEDDVKAIMHQVNFGNYGEYQDDDESTNDVMWRMLKEFIRSLGLDPDEEHPAEDFEDLEFVGLVGYDSGEVEDDRGNLVPQYPEKNILLKVIPQED